MRWFNPIADKESSQTVPSVGIYKLLYKPAVLVKGGPMIEYSAGPGSVPNATRISHFDLVTASY